MTIEYLDIQMITTKQKVVTYTDEELDKETDVIVTVPLRTPKLSVHIKVHLSDGDFSVGAPYLDDNQFPYIATTMRTLAGTFETSRFLLPKQFIKVGSSFKEG